MKTPVIYIYIAAIALGTGITGGIIAKRTSGEIVDYENFDSNSIEIDANANLSKYENYKGNSPETYFTPAELINVGLEKYRRCDNSYSIGIGLASTIVSQTIRNYQIKNGDTFFEESISRSSMVSLANRMVQVGKDGNVTLYAGSATSDVTGAYKNNGKEYEKEKYKEYLGKSLDEMFIYIISNVTTKEGKIEKVEDKYVIDVSLDPDFSTYHYKFQMKNISGLDELPVFSRVNLKFTLTKEMMLEHLTVDEVYKAKMGVTVTITNAIEYYYYANQEMKIPELNESLDYSIGG